MFAAVVNKANMPPGFAPGVVFAAAVNSVFNTVVDKCCTNSGIDPVKAKNLGTASIIAICYELQQSLSQPVRPSEPGLPQVFQQLTNAATPAPTVVAAPVRGSSTPYSIGAPTVAAAVRA